MEKRDVRKEVRKAVAEYVSQHPKLTYAQIAKTLGCHVGTIAVICKEFGVTRRRQLGVEQLKALEENYVERK
jgi:hypothetical protein